MELFNDLSVHTSLKKLYTINVSTETSVSELFLFKEGEVKGVVYCCLRVLRQKVRHNERLCVTFIARGNDTMDCKCKTWYPTMCAFEGKNTSAVIFHNCSNEITEFEAWV